jgi:hypothetical protein
VNAADHYRKRAAEFESVARSELNPAARVEWLKMALSYKRLAELADRNAQTHLVYEPPFRPSSRPQKASSSQK